jgi:hypothetical protein
MTQTTDASKKKEQEEKCLRGSFLFFVVNLFCLSFVFGKNFWTDY